MNCFLPINNKKIGILGAGKSGMAAAKLAHNLGADVFISDLNKKDKISKEIRYEFGKHSKEILKSDIVIKSPGIDNKSKIVKEIIDLSIPLVSEIEFASWFTDSFIIALTGTNGKTTTIQLINNILKRGGLKTFLGGNVGIPFSENVFDEIFNKDYKKNDTKKVFHILEISSFQLEDIKYFKPNISIILNITPDHLDRHKSFKSYLDTKLKILTNQNDKCYAIINKNDVKISKQKYKSNIIEFYISESGEMIVNDKIKIMDIQNSKLLGSHNYQNILAASIVADLCKISDKLILESINFFKPLYHRLEKLTPIKNIIYYNDSKATNLSATVAAIESIDKNIILILGGIDKNNSDFSILKNYKSKIKHIILYGQSRHHIEKQINNFFNLISYSDFKKAIKKAIKISVLNDNILFSPACASFDQFKNYKERGNYFKEIISNYYDQN